MSWIQDNIIDRQRTFIIAEAGINHNGHMDLALELITRAKDVGADCVKFQAFSTEACESESASMPEYFSGRIGKMTKFEWSRSLEFTENDFRALKNYCEEIGLVFLATACDTVSLDLLKRLGVSAIKIGSSDTTNISLLKLAGQSSATVLLSTGMSSIGDIDKAVNCIRENGGKDIILLQCTSQYPAPYEELNLRVIELFKERYHLPVGFSDHSSGIHVPVAAVTLGAQVIEKHFTLSRDLPGVDHAASLTPGEFAAMVKNIRETEAALGEKRKNITRSESKNKNSMRKSIVAANNIKKGAATVLENFAIKRPGTGLAPEMLNTLIGKTARVDIRKDELISMDMFL